MRSPSFKKNLEIESHSPKDALCQVWLKLAQWFWRKRFLNFAILYLSPLGTESALHLNKLKSPSPKDTLGQISLKLAKWFLRRRFFIYFQYNFAISQLSPLGKKKDPSFEPTWIPINQRNVVQSFVKIGPVVLGNMIFQICQCIFAIL